MVLLLLLLLFLKLVPMLRVLLPFVVVFIVVTGPTPYSNPIPSTHQTVGCFQAIVDFNESSPHLGSFLQGLTFSYFNI